jgi:hypothetical protein
MGVLRGGGVELVVRCGTMKAATGTRSAGSLGTRSAIAQGGDTVTFGDKLKDLRKQAQDAVADNRDKIHDAVDVVSTTVDQKTGGKHTAKIARFGEQAGAAVDRFSESDDEAGNPTHGGTPPA